LHLAMQTYDLVDKHIQRLDKSLRKYEEDVEHRTFFSSSPPPAVVGRSNADVCVYVERRRDMHPIPGDD